MSDRTKTRITQALVSMGRVFCYAATGTFLGMSTVGNVVGGVPDVSTLRTAAIAAGWSGTIAAIAFLWNLFKPRVELPPTNDDGLV